MKKLRVWLMTSWRWLIVIIFLVTGLGLVLAFTPFHPVLDERPLLALNSDVMASAGRAKDAWIKEDSDPNNAGIVNNFNEIELPKINEQRKSQGLKEIPQLYAYWEPKNTYTKISAGYQLPDLYLTRASGVAQYSTSQASSQMRTFDANGKINKTLLSEYNYKDMQYGLPLFKSYDITVLNTKVYYDITGQKFDTKNDPHFKYSDILNLVEQYNSKDEYKGNIGFGLDDLPNQLYLNQSTGKGAIDPFNNQNFTFDVNKTGFRDNFDLKFNIKDADYYDKMHESGAFMGAIVKNGQKQYTSTEFKNGKMLMTSSSSAGLWAFSVDPFYLDKKTNRWVANKAYPKDYKTGDMSINKKSPNYIKWKSDHPNDPDSKYDIMGDPKSIKPNGEYNESLTVVYNPTKNGGDRFYSQGLGLAGFKSVGKNADLKEETVKEFTKYLLDEKITYKEGTNLNKAANAANYIPATEFGYKQWESKVYGINKELKNKDPLTNSAYQVNNPADSFVREALGTLWINNYLINRSSFNEVFTYDNFKKYTNFGDLFNRSKIVQ
ncbi:hypothetical protein [Mesoplasma lactucae]|uniref:Uncharacterized protein n=1 Tax=Mesoplasma lactucae ATCC 49193 TaxID=81460 RepID=A0A291IQT1_9MOLU|nr:hypothetical protein [Mesoplasma lactucae]ATG97149.1 hypothetical protein CP520_00005 [Mesoplasma lactucae ATCC 49193]ATZ20412.1 hypothetical protein MLACT_v1c05910 [Mesoplasma lactucae ATCC 49193]MCL8216583.1 hypothetical protein [Mesoplasma lactucae ATCC 49193]